MVSRRRFLLGASVVATGAAAGVVFAGQDTPLGLPEAQAAPPGDRFRYRSRDVQITPSGNMVHITVDGRHGIHVDRDGSDYLTHLLPFTAFKNPRKLAESAIDAEADGLLIL